MLIWNVYVSDFNSRKMVPHNVFNHAALMDDCRKNYRKNANDREAFFAKMKTDLMYYYWSKCEWEIVLSHWPPHKDDPDTKIDAFDQIELNWDRFCDYVWEHRTEFKASRKKRTNSIKLNPLPEDKSGDN